jgi:hypothetical protein
LATPHTRQRDFLARAASVREKARQERARGQTLKTQFDQLKVQLDEQTQHLKTEADSAAQKFRRLYSEASDAYNSDQKALAKSLSIEGKRAQAECESLNSQASALRGRLDSLKTEYESSFEAGKIGMREAKEAEISAKNARTTVIDLGRSDGGDEEAVENFLDRLPQSVLQNVRQIAYDENLAWVSPDGQTKVASRGMTEWLPGGDIHIRIGNQPRKRGLSPQDLINATIAHELGHVCYDKLSDESKAEWFALHAETPADRFYTHDVFENDEEDFAECFRFHAIEPKTLQKHDMKKTQFMNVVFSMLSRP